MMRLGLYMNDLSLHDMSREMVLSGIKPMHQLEKTLEKVSELSPTSTFRGQLVGFSRLISFFSFD